jgi:hypothetical protein
VSDDDLDRLAEQLADMLEHLRFVLNGPLGPEIVDRMNTALADTRFSVVPCTPARSADDVDDEDRVEAVRRWLRQLSPEQQAEIAKRLEFWRALTVAALAQRDTSRWKPMLQ